MNGGLKTELLTGALMQCQKILAVLVNPENKGSGINNMLVWANCVAAEARARSALNATKDERHGDLISRLLAASKDERLSTGALYREAANAIAELSSLKSAKNGINAH